MYTLLKDNNFNFGYEVEEWEIHQPFVDIVGKKVRGIKYTPDFPVYFPDLTVIIETKGRPNDSWALKLKLIKKHMASDERLSKAKYLIPQNQQHCREVVEVLKEYRRTGIFSDWIPPKKEKPLKPNINESRNGLYSARRNKLLSAEARKNRPKSTKSKN